MGMAFLNKKSWHSGSFVNIEKVWIAEEKYKDERQKYLEKKKKLVEEKYSDELKENMIKAGLLPESVRNKIDWMYDDFNQKEDKNLAEEYLLGNKKIEKVEDIQAP